jgi:hypothetical protein
MRGAPVKQSLLSELQGHLSADLFASATPVRRGADEVLFVAGDAGNGYRVEGGLVIAASKKAVSIRHLVLGSKSLPPQCGHVRLRTSVIAHSNDGVWSESPPKSA